jgi:hypothetical protein
VELSCLTLSLTTDTTSLSQWSPLVAQKTDLGHTSEYPSATHEAVSQPSSTANNSPVTLGQMPSGKRKRKSTDEGQGGNAEGSEENAGASGSVPNLVASGPRADAQHPSPPDTKKRTETRGACDRCCNRKIRSVLFFLAAISNNPRSHGLLTLSSSSDLGLHLIADPSSTKQLHFARFRPSVPKLQAVRARLYFLTSCRGDTS